MLGYFHTAIHESRVVNCDSWIAIRITHCLLQATKQTHLIVRIPAHANQQTLWSTPITKSSICTFLILLHATLFTTVSITKSHAYIFFFKFLWRKPWTYCVSIQNCLDLLCFGLNIKLWSPIAHDSIRLWIFYQMHYLTRFLFFELAAFCYPAFQILFCTETAKSIQFRGQCCQK